MALVLALYTRCAQRTLYVHSRGIDVGAFYLQYNCNNVGGNKNLYKETHCKRECNTLGLPSTHNLSSCSAQHATCQLLILWWYALGHHAGAALQFSECADVHTSTEQGRQQHRRARIQGTGALFCEQFRAICTCLGKQCHNSACTRLTALVEGDGARCEGWLVVTTHLGTVITTQTYSNWLLEACNQAVQPLLV